MKSLYAQIFRNMITYHRNQIKFYCMLARQSSGGVRQSALSRAKEEAAQIKQSLIDWKLSFN